MKCMECGDTCVAAVTCLRCTDKLKAENEKLRGLIKGNEEICQQRNNELRLHKAAAKAAKSGSFSDLKKYIKLRHTLTGE